MKRAALFTVVIMAAVVVLAGRDGNDASARVAATQAVARTLDAGSSRLTVSVEFPRSLPDLQGGVVGHGVMDYVHRRGRISYVHDRDVIFDGRVTYVKWPLPWHKRPRWLRVENDGRDTVPLDLQERATRNPNGLLEFLAGASDDVHEGRPESVRGTSTRLIEGTLDLQKVVDRSPADQRAQLQEWLDLLAEDTRRTVPFQLWIDDQGVARRLRIEQDGAGAVTVEFYDFGIPVKVAPPPATDIVGPRELANEFRAHLSDSTCGSSSAVAAGSTVGDGAVRLCLRPLP